MIITEIVEARNGHEDVSQSRCTLFYLMQNLMLNPMKLVSSQSEVRNVVKIGKTLIFEKFDKFSTFEGDLVAQF